MYLPEIFSIKHLIASMNIFPIMKIFIPTETEFHKINERLHCIYEILHYISVMKHFR